jgi:hypothetical protein
MWENLTEQSMRVFARVISILKFDFAYKHDLKTSLDLD